MAASPNEELRRDLAGAGQERSALRRAPKHAEHGFSGSDNAVWWFADAYAARSSGL